MAPQTSRIVEFYDANRKQIAQSRILGWIYTPLCCAGMICRSEATIQKNNTKYIDKIVSMYSRDELQNLAPKVADEHQLFLKAATEVNIIALKENKRIFPHITLIDVLGSQIPIITSISKEFEFWSANTDEKKEYLQKIYKTYIELGGNISVAIYGLPELIAINIDLTKDGYIRMFDGIDTEKQFKMIACETQLHDLILSCKDNACLE